MKNVLIAFGGNAILPAGQDGTYEEQLANIRYCCQKMAELTLEGYNLILTHGNGPQVGNLLIQNEWTKDQIPPQPLHACVAQTQGQLGFMIQCELENELRKKDLDITTTTLITRVLVDKADEAFGKCTKPVGPFFTKEHAEERINLGETWINDSGRGWRKLVPSPKPQKILELNIIRALLKQKIILIAAGGGGIPVIEEDNHQIVGVDAVIDKDLASTHLAKELNLDIMLLLTDVDCVKLNFNQPNEIAVSKMTINEAEEYICQGQFGLGSMTPKISAAVDFVKAGGCRAIITSFKYIKEAIEGKAGTTIVAF